MNNKKTNYDIFRENLLSKPGVQEYYDSLQPEMEMIMAAMNLRNKYGLTQKGISELTGINRNDISKIEHGNINIRINTLQKLARALNTKLEIKFVPVKY